MRNIEKGVLLAELFNVDTSKYVSSFIEWIKGTKEYHYYLEKRKELNKKRTWKARRFLSYFESIDIDSIESIREGVIEYGKICYLVKITSEPAYTNPLIVENLDNEDMKIGDIPLIFDGKMITLRELAKLEGFSFERKEEAINDKLQNWINEVESSIIDPLSEYQEHNFYFPKIKLWSPFRIFELVYLLLINTFIILVSVIKIPLFENIVGDTSSIDYMFYLIFAGAVLVFDLIYIIVMISRLARYGYYIKARDGVFENIHKEKLNSENKLRLYLYAQLATSGNMEAKVSEFAKIAKYYPYIGYLRKRLSMKKRIRVDRITSAEIAGLLITLACVVALVLMILL